MGEIYIRVGCIDFVQNFVSKLWSLREVIVGNPLDLLDAKDNYKYSDSEAIIPLLRLVINISIGL